MGPWPMHDSRSSRPWTPSMPRLMIPIKPQHATLVSKSSWILTLTLLRRSRNPLVLPSCTHHVNSTWTLTERNSWRMKESRNSRNISPNSRSISSLRATIWPSSSKQRTDSPRDKRRRRMKIWRRCGITRDFPKSSLLSTAILNS